MGSCCGLVSKFLNLLWNIFFLRRVFRTCMGFMALMHTASLEELEGVLDLRWWLHKHTCKALGGPCPSRIPHQSLQCLLDLKPDHPPDSKAKTNSKAYHYFCLQEVLYVPATSRLIRELLAVLQNASPGWLFNRIRYRQWQPMDHRWRFTDRLRYLSTNTIP